MSMNNSGIEQMQRAAATSLHKHWALYVVEGTILCVLGLAAVFIPQMATLAVDVLLGWVFLISGISGLITTVWMRRSPGFLWALISAVLGIAVGIILVLWPQRGVLSLTLVLIMFFVIEGLASIMFALDHKRGVSGRWGMMLVSGVVDLILAGIIIAGLPGTAGWALGLLVGINMVFGGSALIAMALQAREAAGNSTAPGP